MIISENYKRRLRELSGNIIQEIKLNAISGRSGQNSLGYYVEEYLLNLVEKILNEIDQKIKNEQFYNLVIFQNETKISNNSLTTSFEIENILNKNDIKKIKFILTTMVQIESGCNTVSLLKYETVNDEFNLESKHSEKDIEDYINEITIRIFNVIKID